MRVWREHAPIEVYHLRNSHTNEMLTYIVAKFISVCGVISLGS